MAIPTQGGLGQVSKPSVDASAVQAENIEELNKPKPPSLKEKVFDDVAEQREAMNRALLRISASLDDRKNRMFDPVLMQAASGFLKPTKSGSFSESLGYAAENSGLALERQMIQQKENQKLEVELLGKEMEFGNQKRIADYRLSRLKNDTNPTATSAPIGSSATLPGNTPTPVPSAALNMSSGTIPKSEEQSTQYVPITPAMIEETYAVDPSGKLAKELEDIAKLQREDIISVGDRPYSKSQQKFLAGNPDAVIERDFGAYVGIKKVPVWFAKQFDVIADQSRKENNPRLLFDFLLKYNMIDPSAKKDIAGETKYQTIDQKKRDDEIILDRLKAQVGEEKGQITQLETNARMGRDTINITKDIRSITEANRSAFELLNDTGIADAVKRAAERGITAGSLGNFSIPTRELETYKLSSNDRQALQMFAQKQAALTVQFRKSARAPNEGTTTESEGRLFSELGAMPSDTANVIRLKMEALEEKGKYDQEVFKAWAKFSEDPSNTYRKFLASAYNDNGPLKAINDAYDSRLEKMRTANAELFRTMPKPAAIPSVQPTPPASKVESPLEKFKREKAERDKKS